MTALSSGAAVLLCACPLQPNPYITAEGESGTQGTTAGGSETDSGMGSETDAGTETGTDTNTDTDGEACVAEAWYKDEDGDGWGSGAAVCACEIDAPAGRVDKPGDCDDELEAVHPETNEDCDAQDNDCDGLIDEGCGDIAHDGGTCSLFEDSAGITAYWVCTGALWSWSQAQDACATIENDRGLVPYLLEIKDMQEWELVSGELSDSESYWIHLREATVCTENCDGFPKCGNMCSNDPIDYLNCAEPICTSACLPGDSFGPCPWYCYQDSYDHCLHPELYPGGLPSPTYAPQWNWNNGQTLADWGYSDFGACADDLPAPEDLACAAIPETACGNMEARSCATAKATGYICEASLWAAPEDDCDLCGEGCDANTEVCAGSLCECKVGFVRCGDSCVDTDIDPAHCGGCDAEPCGQGQACSAGACIDARSCELPMTACGDSCVDLDSNATHCGACDNDCSASEICANGNCSSYGATDCATCPCEDVTETPCVELIDGEPTGYKCCDNTEQPGAICVTGACPAP